MTLNIMYDRAAIEKYYDRIKLEKSRRIYDVRRLSDGEALSHLGLLMKLHLINIPFENLSLHYSQERQVSLHPTVLFRKIINGNGRGGYCMENNAVLACLLRSIGYNLYSTGARIWAGNVYMGWTHIINLIHISKQQYLVDVGYGPNCVTSPIPLIHNEVHINISPAAVRLVYAKLEGAHEMSPKVWQYQHRRNDGTDFINQYCFSDIEFFRNDFDVINSFTSTSPRSIFNQRIICIKMIPAEDDYTNIIGCLILQHDLKRRIRGETVLLESFSDEEQRLEALRREFQITFSPEEQQGIQGLSTAIGQPAFVP